MAHLGSWPANHRMRAVATFDQIEEGLFERCLGRSIRTAKNVIQVNLCSYPCGARRHLNTCITKNAWGSLVRKQARLRHGVRRIDEP